MPKTLDLILKVFIQIQIFQDIAVLVHHVEDSLKSKVGDKLSLCWFEYLYRGMVLVRR